MNSIPGSERLTAAYQTALSALLAERNSDGYWTGELSSSALSTATAVSALALVDKNSRHHQNHQEIIARGLTWLAAHQNTDGGWGDTIKSLSNISTTMLCRAAIHLAGKASDYAGSMSRAEKYLQEHFGPTASEQAEWVRARYGKDRTFAVPILATCALASLVEWEEVKSLPFELGTAKRNKTLLMLSVRHVRRNLSKHEMKHKLQFRDRSSLKLHASNKCTALLLARSTHR